MTACRERDKGVVLELASFRCFPIMRVANFANQSSSFPPICCEWLPNDLASPAQPINHCFCVTRASSAPQLGQNNGALTKDKCTPKIVDYGEFPFFQNVDVDIRIDNGTGHSMASLCYLVATFRCFVLKIPKVLRIPPLAPATSELRPNPSRPAAAFLPVGPCSRPRNMIFALIHDLHRTSPTPSTRQAYMLRLEGIRCQVQVSTWATTATRHQHHRSTASSPLFSKMLRHKFLPSRSLVVRPHQWLRRRPHGTETKAAPI